MSEAAGPDPRTVFETFTAYQRSGALKAAIELDLFTAVGEGATTVAALAKRCQASERGIRMLADYMTTLGFLTKDGSTYGLSPNGAVFLDQKSMAYIGAAVTFICSPELWDGFARVADAVRKGGTVLSAEGTTSVENPICVDFARAMNGIQGMQAQLTANVVEMAPDARCKILDIAAGHGQFGIALAARNPKAEVVALDWANVLTVAEENARKAGILDRFRKLPGSAFEVDYGADYDIVLLPNILHHFDPEGCHQILTKVHRALKPGGRAVTVEFVPNDDRVTPPEAATFNLVMLVTTPSGDAYTFAELEGMFRRAGFARSELRSMEPAVNRVVISTR